MSDPRAQITAASAEVAALSSLARRALEGQAEFGPEQLRTLKSVLDRMDPLMLQSAQLRREQPELRPDLDAYKALLTELEPLLERIRVMLLARRAQMVLDRGQLEAVARWSDALRQTHGG